MVTLYREVGHPVALGPKAAAGLRKAEAGLRNRGAALEPDGALGGML